MSNRLFIVLTTILMTSFAVQAQHAGHHEHDEHGNCVEADTLENANVWSTEDGTMYFTCPVMKGEGRVENASAFSMVDGKRYFHCCPPCQGPFRADPQRWLSDFALPANIVRVDGEGRKHFRDPVTGVTAPLEENTLYADYSGSRYFFATEESMQAFRPEE